MLERPLIQQHNDLQCIVDLPCNEKLQEKLIVTVPLLFILGTPWKKRTELEKKLSRDKLTSDIVSIMTKETKNWINNMLHKVTKH